MKAQASEHQIQAALFRWWNMRAPLAYRDMMFAIPNGGAREAITGAMLKAEGVRPGVPDIFFAWPCNGYHGLWLELKRPDGRPTEAQLTMLSLLSGAGYMAKICYGLDEAMNTINAYLAGEL